MSISKKELQLLELKKQQEQRELFQRLSDMNHKIPKTRREFLAHGLITATTSLALPTLSQLISASAWGADVDVSCQGAESNFPAFIHLQLAGGAALFANYLQCKKGGQPLGGTPAMGVGTAPRSEPLFSNGAPFWMRTINENAVDPMTTDNVSGSHMVIGMRRRYAALAAGKGGTTTLEQFLQKGGFCAVAHESRDDFVDNKQELSGILRAAGIAGSTLPYLVTDHNAGPIELFSSPGSRFAPAIYPGANFLNVVNSSSLLDSMGFRGALSFGGSIATQGALLKAINDLSLRQVQALANVNRTHDSQRVFEGLLKCATEKNVKTLTGTPDVDVFNGYSKPEAAGIWTGPVGVLDNSVLTKLALTVCNVMSGKSGAACINLGGYDYHTDAGVGTQRSTASRKDREFGDVLVRIMATANLFNRKVFILVSTDGSTFAPASESAFVSWVNDSQKKGTSYMIGYDPASSASSPVTMTGTTDNQSYQINCFNDAAEVDLSHPIASSDNQELFAATVFLNYLNFAKKPDVLKLPALGAVKSKLEAALPGSAGTIDDYFARFKV